MERETYTNLTLKLEKLYDHEIAFIMKNVIPNDDGSHSWIKRSAKIKTAYDILNFVLADDREFEESLSLFVKLDLGTAFEAVVYSNALQSVWASCNYEDNWIKLLNSALVNVFQAKMLQKSSISR